jgi:hypothetical protein
LGWGGTGRIMRKVRRALREIMKVEQRFDSVIDDGNGLSNGNSISSLKSNIYTNTGEEKHFQ